MNKIVYEIIDYDSKLDRKDAKVDTAVGNLNVAILEQNGSVYIHTLDENKQVIKHNLNYEIEHSALLNKAKELLNEVAPEIRDNISYKLMQYEEDEKSV